MIDQTVRKVITGSAIGAVVSCTAITVVGILVIPEVQRSSWFWPRIAWVNVLTVIAWIALTVFFAQISRRVRKIEGFGGVAPSVTYFLLYFVVSGFFGVFMSSYILQSGIWEVASQIYNAAGLIISSVLLYFSWLGATADVSRPQTGIAQPSLLAQQIRQTETLLEKGRRTAQAAELVRQLKRLREFIQYSLPDVGPFAASEFYAQFSQDTQALINDLGLAELGERQFDFDVEIFSTRAQTLLSSAKQCSVALRN